MYICTYINVEFEFYCYIYINSSPYGNSGPWMNPYYPGAQRASNNPLATVLNGIAATTPFLFLIQKYLEQLHG